MSKSIDIRITRPKTRESNLPPKKQKKMCSLDFYFEKGRSLLIEAVNNRKQPPGPAPLSIQAPKFNMLDLSYDPVLNEKLKLVQEALDEIGLTWFHLKLFVYSGTGILAESVLTYCYVYTYRYMMKNQDYSSFPYILQMFYSGSLIGAIHRFFFTNRGFLLFDLGDTQKYSMLLFCLVGIYSYHSDSFHMFRIQYYLSIFFSGYMAIGSSFTTDARIFFDFLPSKYRSLSVLLFSWKSMGQIITSFAMMTFMKNSDQNMSNESWKMVWYFTTIFMFCFHFFSLTLNISDTNSELTDTPESPQLFVTCGCDEEAFSILHSLSVRYGRKIALTLDQLKHCGYIDNKYSIISTATSTKSLRSKLHVMVSSKNLKKNTIALTISWLVIGVIYSLLYDYHFIFLHTISESHSTIQEYSVDSLKIYGKLVFISISGLFGPIVGSSLTFCMPQIGKKPLLYLSGIVAMILLLIYYVVNNDKFASWIFPLCYCITGFNYSLLWSYTFQVTPRSCKIPAMAFVTLISNFSKFLVPPIAYFVGFDTGAPILVSSMGMGVISFTTLFLQFEP